MPFADLHGRQQIWYAEQAASFQQYIREVKGDQDYVAESAWPLRPLDDPLMFEDTIPLPIPKPRPSATIPTFDFGETLALEAPHTADWRTVRRSPSSSSSTRSSRSRSRSTFRRAGERPIVIEPAAIQPALSDPVAWPPRRSSSRSPRSRPAGPKPNVIRIAAAVVTDMAGRSLLVRKRGSTIFMQPGGKIESGESALDALTRELREEIGDRRRPGRDRVHRQLPRGRRPRREHGRAGRGVLPHDVGRAGGRRRDRGAALGGAPR